MKNFLRKYASTATKAKLLKVYRVASLITKPAIFLSWLRFNKLNSQTLNATAGAATIAPAYTMHPKNRFTAKFSDMFPISGEDTPYTIFDRHYVYHTAWAARVVSEIKPAKHIDISSSLYFSTSVSAFVPVDFYDYRPAALELSNLQTHAGDLMKLPFTDKSIESISCMHTIEHIGLGRYGDPMDPNGDLKAIKELMRVVKPGGNLLLVMPVGKQRIEYNAHRIYSPDYIRQIVCDDIEPGQFELKEYAFIPETNDEGGLKRNTNINMGANAFYACGCFWFKRKI